MGRHTRHYSPSELERYTKTITDDSGNISLDKNGYAKRAVNLGEIYSKSSVKNEYAGSSRQIFAAAGEEIHNYAESVLRFVDKNFDNGSAESISALIETSFQQNADLLKYHVAKEYAPNINKALRNLVQEVYTGKNKGDILFMSENDLYSTLDEKSGLGVRGKPDMAFYDKTINTVRITDAKSIFNNPADELRKAQQYLKSAQSYVYPVVVHDNFSKVFHFDLPDNVKYDMEFLIIPPNTKDGKGYITSKTQNIDASEIQKYKAYLLQMENSVQYQKSLYMRHEEVGGSKYAMNRAAENIGSYASDICKLGKCSTCSMKNFCASRNYLELANEINGDSNWSSTQTSLNDREFDDRQERINKALEEDRKVENYYKRQQNDIAEEANAAKISDNISKDKVLDEYLYGGRESAISESYETLKRVIPSYDGRLSKHVGESKEGSKTIKAIHEAAAASAHIPASILEDNMYQPRWLHGANGKETAKHLETFAKGIISRTAHQFAMDPNSVSDLVMQRVFTSKKVADNLSSIVEKVARDHFKKKSRYVKIGAEEVDSFMENIGAHLKNANLVKAIGEHVQDTTLAVIDQSTNKLKDYISKNNIYPTKDRTQAEALKWYVKEQTGFNESVQSTFEKIRKTNNFSGIVSRFTLSDKRFPLPMAIAAMMLSYASAQSSVRNQLVNVLNKGQEYRRYENDDVPEAGHASLLTMAQRLVSSAFGSGFQKLRTTYQDIANRVLMNNRLFETFKDATSKGYGRSGAGAYSAIKSGIASKLATPLVVAAAGGFAAAFVLPMIKTKRDIGKEQRDRKKRFKKLKYAKTNSSGDSTNYQKSSDLRSGYKAHTGFGSPFNIGVFETLFVGLRRIAEEELPSVIKGASSFAGKIEAFFENKVKNAVSTISKNPAKLTAESIQKYDPNAVLTKMYENQETLRTGEQRTVDYVKVKREADFHTFGVQRTNTTPSRIASQYSAIQAQSELAPNRLVSSVEEKAIAAARADGNNVKAMEESILARRSNKIPSTKLSHRNNIKEHLVPSNYIHPSKTFVEPKVIKKLSESVDGYTGRKIKRDFKRHILPKKLSVSSQIESAIVQSSKNKYRDISSKISEIAVSAKNISMNDVSDYMMSNKGKQTIEGASLVLPVVQAMSHQKKTIATSASHGFVSADLSLARETSRSNYREATRVERYVAKKSSSAENRKRF